MEAWNTDRIFQDELPLFQWKISCFFFVIGFLIRNAMCKYLKVTLFPCTQKPSQENAAIVTDASLLNLLSSVRLTSV